MKIDIIIPNWNMSELCVACLKSIQEHTQDFRIIFVDNGSDQFEFQWIDRTLRTMPNILIRNPENLGFVKAVNIGMDYVTAPYFILMNNDAEAVEGWVEKLLEPMKENPDIMIAGAKPSVGYYLKREMPTKGWATIPKKEMVSFFCAAFNKSILRKIGKLDENFGVGLGDDNDYCNRVHKKGYKIALVDSLVLPHHHRSTFKKLYTSEQVTEMQLEAIKYLKKKK